MQKPQALLMLSIDLEQDILHPVAGDERGLDEVTRRLVDLFHQHAIPATWAVADPALSAATDVILGSPHGHEIAILGDQAWVGIGAGRTRFARELNRRVEGARSMGLNISTLALRNAKLDEHLDLLVKHRICVVRSGSTDVSATQGFQPQSLRFGVWEAPVTCRLPGKRSWFFGGGWQARRALRQAVANGETIHFAIDGPQLLAAGNGDFRSLDRVLRLAASFREQGLLAVSTLNCIADSTARRSVTTVSRSILSKAA